MFVFREECRKGSGEGGGVRTSRIYFQQAGRASASCGRQAGLPSRKADAVLAPNQNIENNPMQSNKVSQAWML